MKIKLNQINLDLQTRAKMDGAVIEEYKAAMEDGAKFPDIDVFFDGEIYWLADGFHRVHASLAADFRDIEAIVRDGQRLDALKFALASNQSHGLRRTNDDKRRCVKLALESFPGYSARQVAETCGVGHQLVLDVKAMDESSNAQQKVKCKDGREYPASKPKKAEPKPVEESAFPAEPDAEVQTADEEVNQSIADENVLEEENREHPYPGLERIQSAWMNATLKEQGFFIKWLIDNGDINPQ